MLALGSLFPSVPSHTAVHRLQQSDTLLFKHFDQTERKFPLASSFTVCISHILPCSPAHFFMSGSRMSHCSAPATFITLVAVHKHFMTVTELFLNMIVGHLTCWYVWENKNTYSISHACELTASLFTGKCLYCISIKLRGHCCDWTVTNYANKRRRFISHIQSCNVQPTEAGGRHPNSVEKGPASAGIQTQALEDFSPSFSLWDESVFQSFC